MIAPGPPAAAVKRGARQTQAPSEAMELLVAVGEQVAPHTSAPLEHQLVHIDGHDVDRDMARAFPGEPVGWDTRRGSADSRLASADRDRHALLVIAIDQGQHVVATADRPPGHQPGGRARGVRARTACARGGTGARRGWRGRSRPQSRACTPTASGEPGGRAKRSATADRSPGPAITRSRGPGWRRARCSPPAPAGWPGR